jgi:PIN domain nuclease of toxin-antitoxin system
MIVLDTHIWFWWMQNDPRLRPVIYAYLNTHLVTGLGVSIFSCWKIAQLDAGGKIVLPAPIRSWLSVALQAPGIHLLELTPEIVVEANNLPGTFHRDPADRSIVATARVHGYPLVTEDNKIRQYPHVQIAP